MLHNNAAIGARIKHFRKKRGLSQMLLAEKVGCTPTYISFIESGSKCMSISTLIKVANALNASADDILQDCLVNTIKVSNHAFAEVVTDCSDLEKRILLDVVKATKQSLRNPPPHV